MTARSPEVGDGGADGHVVIGRELVDVTRVRDLALGRGIDAVDLARRQVLEVRQAISLCQRVHPRVLQELFARLIHLGDRGVEFKETLARQFPRKVVACVQELEKAADCIQVFFRKLDLTGLCSWS